MKRFRVWSHHPISFRVFLALTLFTLATVGSAAADGPALPGSLPGGAPVGDDDPGSGEQWGRANGRNLSISVNDPSLFTALSWGVVSATAPVAAFDGAVDEVGETMSFDALGSNLAGGVARWVGEAEVELVDTNPSTFVTLPTRFTLTVTNPGAVPLAFVLGEVNPGINVLTSGPFNANLFFEAFYPVSIGGDDSWHPLLDLFDLLDTNTNVPGGGQLAQTGVNTGFYFTTDEGLSLEDHDANISGQIADVKDDTAFLRIDAINRLQGLGVDLDELADMVAWVKTDLGSLQNEVGMIPKEDLSDEIAMVLALLQGGGGDPPATGEDLQQLQDEITDILLILFGLAPCPPEAGPLCDSATFVDDLATESSLQMAKDEIQEQLELLQETLEEVPASVELEVEVIDISEGNPHERQWLVKTTRDGTRVDAALTTLLLMRATNGGVPVTDDVLAQANVTSIAVGVQEVFVDLSNPQNKELRAVLFELSVYGDSPATGSALVNAEQGGKDNGA